MNKEPVITEAELFAELDALRRQPPGPLLTDEQFKAIHYARSTKPRVSFPKLAMWWESKGWGAILENTLVNRYHIDCKRRGIT